MENKEQIVKAMLAVRKAVKKIEKTMNVGSGNNSYKGVSDEVVKKAIGDAMEENGLICIPISIEPKSEVTRWTDQFGKDKQSVFTEVKTKYLLLHESGQSLEIEGYGHGVDTQDKGAGKATTYALKYALLYAFLIPTGKIDDADTQHSDNIESAPNPFIIALNEAIGKLANVNSKDELKDFAELLPAEIKTDQRFRTAATTRTKQFTQTTELA